MPRPDERLFRVRPDQAKQTLGAVLRQYLPQASWGEVRKLIGSRRVFVSGNLCLDPARRLKVAEVIKVLRESAAPLPTGNDVAIRYVDPHVVVVEKPAGMTSVRHTEERDWPAQRKQKQPTLSELLPAVLARSNEGKSHRGRALPVRAVHRLDRETSGLMLFARTIPAERHLGQQFRRHTVHRRYLAIVHGDCPAQTISSRLVRDRGDGRRGGTTQPNVGKPAVTHVRPLQRLARHTLIECRLETGRTHQIRIHLSEAGFPLCGDKVYRQPLHRPPIKDESGAKRLALHAAELGFIHPATGEELRFEMPMPEDMAALLAALS